MKDLGVVGVVARFKPVHKGHVVMLESVCERADRVIIGLGSCNRYNVRNPFSAKESAEMIDLVLKPKYNNYTFIEIPDVDNGPKWREIALKLYGELDYFVTANDYVESLLRQDYKIIHPLHIIPRENQVWGNATMVRTAMAKGEPWEDLVPEIVAEYLKSNKLVDRFCRDFGLETIAASIDDVLKGVR